MLFKMQGMKIQKINFVFMPANKKYISWILPIGFFICHSVLVKAQQVDTLKKSDMTEAIDTSDYLPAFYESSLDYNLMIAASKGYVSEIDRLIGEGADINTTTTTGVTPLMFAVLNNSLPAVKALLKYKPDLEKLTSSFETALIMAVKNNDFDICEALIRAGADVDFVDRNGATPLHYAAINGYLEITDLLLYYNASINQKSDDGTTPLLAAVTAGYANLADLLVQNGADKEASNNLGFTPFLMASVNGDTLIMDLLFRNGVNIYATTKNHYNALDLAISSDQPEAVNYLLRIGNKWTDISEKAVDPYLVAAKYRRKEIISIMKKNNVPGQVKLGIDQTAVTLSSRLTTRDYYTGISMSFKEPYLNGGIITGLDMKLWDTRVLEKDSEHTYYQYFDKGYMVYAGVFKDFVLSENPFKSTYSFTTTLMAGYSFGHTLKGTLMVPANKFMIIPDLTFKWTRKKFSASLGMEYIKSPFYRIGPVWMRAGLSYTLFFDRVRTQISPIKWY